MSKFDFFRPLLDIDYSQKLLVNSSKPERLEDLACNNIELVKKLIKYRDSRDLEHLILTGPAGVGKKTAVDLLTHSLLGEHHKDNCLYIDGAIDRSRHIVSETQGSNKKTTTNAESNIMNFLKRKTMLTDCFKIIVIYNFEHMTGEAQMALRRIIEKKNKELRFIFICNNYSDIIEAIQSRTCIIQFDSLEPQVIRQVLVKNCGADPAIGNELTELILLTAYGDLKQALIYLQIMMTSENISVESFYQIFGIPHLPIIKKMITDCLSKKTVGMAYRTLQDLLDEGHNHSDIIDMIFKIITINQIGLSQDVQIKLLHAVSRCLMKTEMTNSHIHLYGLLSDFS